MGYLYGYALEAICIRLGQDLPEISGICGVSAWVDEVDAILISQGVPVGLTDLIFGSYPVEIPRPDDYPFIGSWPPRVICEALRASRGVALAGMNPEMADTVGQVRVWLEAAAVDAAYGLIGFLS